MDPGADLHIGGIPGTGLAREPTHDFIAEEASADVFLVDRGERLRRLGLPAAGERGVSVAQEYVDGLHPWALGARRVFDEPAPITLPLDKSPGDGSAKRLMRDVDDATVLVRDPRLPTAFRFALLPGLGPELLALAEA